MTRIGIRAERVGTPRGACPGRGVGSWGRQRRARVTCNRADVAVWLGGSNGVNAA
jgi:hypothetical protein